MSQPHLFRQAERCADAIDQLGRFAAALTWEDLPDSVTRRIPVVLTDLVGVALAGMGTPELRDFVAAWAAPPGTVPVLGSTLRTTAETSAYLAAVAACALELDEGNKHAAGHPAAHVVFAAVVAALDSPRAISGRRFLTAVVAGYEVAARFGRATARNPEWHTHGHWGATGAATAAALLRDGGPAEVGAAIDAATGLMQVTPWETVLSGSFTRNLWMAEANLAGLRAAGLAAAGLVHNSGRATHSLGSIVGTLDPDALVDELGTTWLTAEGYLKRHAACSYTHAAVDLVQSMRAAAPRPLDEIVRVRVRTHSLARPLLGRHPHNRLAAMFSLPFVVSNAVVNGRVDPRTMEPGTPEFAAAEDFSDRVEVEVDEDLDRELPDRRCTEVTIEFGDGSSVGSCAPNPIGDADHFPLTHADVQDKLVALVGESAVARIDEAVTRLVSDDPAGAVLRDILACAS